MIRREYIIRKFMYHKISKKTSTEDAGDLGFDANGARAAKLASVSDPFCIRSS